MSADGVYRAVVELIHAPATNNLWLFRDASFCVLYLALLLVALRAGVPRSWVAASALVLPALRISCETLNSTGSPWQSQPGT